jgi:hypothetical protein
VEEAEKPPTSFNDSLVVTVSGRVGGEGKQPTNESCRFVGGW